MKNALVIHPQFEVIGGAEIVSLRIIGWLIESAGLEVTLMTLLPLDTSTLVRAGVSADTAGKIKFVTAACPRFVAAARSKFHLLKLAYLHRSARRASGDFDVLVSTYNEVDFGKPGIQYIHHPSFPGRSVLQDLGMIDSGGLLDSVPLLNSIYRALASAISGDKVEGFRRNTTLVNSHFMKQVIEQVYGISGQVVYPAFIEETNRRPPDWNDRDLRFVSVGRIARDKNFLTLIEYYSSLHREFPAADFVIAGRRSDKEYETSIVEKAVKLGVPLRMLKDLPDSEMKALLMSSKFYVHPKINEHFGMVITEAAAMGCLPLVHASGASREIVGSPMLLFTSAAELVERARVLLENEAERKKAVGALEKELVKFKSSAFYARLEEVLGPNL